MNQITQFGPYKLIERISVGGMAEVYKATEHGVEGFERTVAVKRILPHIAEDDEFITMFKDEAKIAGQLNHGNIAQIYNLGQQGDSFYIALEYVAGKDLRNIFTRCQQQGRPMPIAQACFVVMKICEGLDYAHNKRDKHGRHLNIVHRDVSPPNILVSYEGEVKLIDFGVAKAAGRVSRTQAGILKGKFGYMSPEQVRGMPLDRRSDVFSLGVVLYEVLVGNRLFQGDTDFATLEMVRTVDVALPSTKNAEISKDLEAIMMKALSGEPETRYQTAMELHDELQAFMFQHGMFYSRKDLAAWMRKQYAREIETEKDKNAGKAPPPKSPVPGAAAGRKPTVPPSPTAKAAPAKTLAPASKAKTLAPPTAAPAGDSLEPTEEQLAAARKRSKTMLMSPSNRPSTLKPGSPPTGSLPTLPKGQQDPLKATIVPGGAPPPAVPRPAPVSPPKAAPSSKQGGGGDLEWDDDELETKLFDEPPGEAAPAGPAGKKQRPEELGPAPPPQAPAAGQIEEEEDDSPATVQLPPNAAAVIIQPLVASQPMQPLPNFPLPVQPIQPIQPVQPVQPIQARVGQRTMPAPELEGVVEETEPGHRKPNIMMIGGIAAGVLLLIVVLAVVFGGGGDKPAGDTVAAGDTAAAATVGALQFELTPADAKATVDGVDVPGTGSPRMASNLSVGLHKISVSFGDAYLPFEQEVSVAAGAPMPIPVKLQVRDVAVTVTTEPADAAIKLAEGDAPATVVGKGGETFKIQRKPGVQYKLIAELAGYDPSETPVTFSGGSTDSFKLALVKTKTGTTTTPPGTTTPPTTPPETKKDPVPKKDPGTTKKAPPKAKTAEIKIGSGPGLPPATVWVDGEKQSKPTPVTVMVAPGKHTIKWKYPDGKTATKSVTAADKSSQVVKGDGAK